MPATPDIGRAPLDAPPPGPRPQPVPQGSFADVPQAQAAAPALNDTQVIEAVMSAASQAEQNFQTIAQVFPESAPTLVQLRDQLRQLVFASLRSTSTPQGGMGALASSQTAGVPF